MQKGHAHTRRWRQRYPLSKLWYIVYRCRPPDCLIQFIDELNMHQRARAMPDFDPIVDAETRRQGGCKQETTVWRPLAVRCVWSIDGAHFGEATSVKDLDFPGKIAKACEGDNSALRVERDEIAWGSTKIVERAHTLVEEYRFRWHVPIDDTKLFRVGAPCKIVYRTFLVKSDSAIEIASSAQKIHPSLAVITLVRVVNFSLSEEKYLSAQCVPLYL